LCSAFIFIKRSEGVPEEFKPIYTDESIVSLLKKKKLLPLKIFF
jgi:hypothetical protein